MTSRRDAKVTVLPTAYPPLDRQPCARCSRLGCTIVALWVEGPDDVPREALYCQRTCAEFDGWPWLGGADATARWREAARP